MKRKKKAQLKLKDDFRPGRVTLKEKGEGEQNKTKRVFKRSKGF